MSIFRKPAVGLAVSTLVAATGVLAAATTAQADTQSCTTNKSYGHLCMAAASRAYNIDYYNTSGKKQTGLNFRAICADGTWLGDLGAFTANAGETKTFSFDTHLNPHGGCYGQLLRNGSEIMHTTSVHT